MSADPPVTDRSSIEDFHLLRTVASGVIQLSDVDSPGAFSLPYPADLQRALDRLVAVTLRRGLTPPRGVPDLMTWCAERPVGDWPLRLPAEVAGADDRLIDRHTRTPTQLCYEWAVDSPDAGTELFERRLMLGAIQLCRSAGSPASYTALRGLFVRRPVLTRTDLALLHSDVDLLPVMELLDEAYLPVPTGTARDGRFAACARCRCLLIPADRDHWWCEQDRCRRDGPARVGAEYPDHSDIRQLARPLRLFVTGPGRAEIELEERLVALGLHVEMWPQYDAYDLRVTLPGGIVWAVDVKDRANPALLGRTATPFPTIPPYGSAYLVVPEYRTTDRPDYQRVFTRNCRPEVADTLTLCTDCDLVRAARAAIRANPEGGTDA